MKGDTFRPAPLTQDAIDRLRQLAGKTTIESVPQELIEQPLPDPDSPYPLDPSRGVLEDDSNHAITDSAEVEIVSADASPLQADLDPVGKAEVDTVDEAGPEVAAVYEAEPEIDATDEVGPDQKSEDVGDVVQS
jgi:hypothetical protein